MGLGFASRPVGPRHPSRPPGRLAGPGVRRPFWLPDPRHWLVGPGGPRRPNVDGGGGIRTRGPLSRTPVFKTGALNRSATPPSTITVAPDCAADAPRRDAAGGSLAGRRRPAGTSTSSRRRRCGLTRPVPRVRRASRLPLASEAGAKRGGSKVVLAREGAAAQLASASAEPRLPRPVVASCGLSPSLG
jgi:hypothetical protein